jgi:fructose-specific component phosphotransferase system IIB-like protein
MRVIILIVLLLACVACGAVPKLDKVDDFSTAASNSIELLKNAAATDRNLAIRVGEEEQANQYISGKAFVLADRPEAMLPPKLFKVRLEALSALQAYAQALKLAVDEGVMSKLEEASLRLGTSAGTMVTTSSPLAGPAIKIAARGIGYALSNAHARRVQKIIRATDPSVKKVVSALKDDLALLSRALSMQVVDYEIERKEALLRVRGDKKVDRLALYKEYKQARQEIATYYALINAIEKHGQILDALKDAHEELAAAVPDEDASLKRFVALTNDAVDLFVASAKGKTP